MNFFEKLLKDSWLYRRAERNKFNKSPLMRKAYIKKEIKSMTHSNMIDSSAIKELIKLHLVQTHVNTFPNLYRYDVINGLVGKNNIGIELGVAEGGFSEMMVKSGKFSHFFGVDFYGNDRGIHDTHEYKFALNRVGLLSNYKLLRMKFDEAVSLFKDDFFDFIYVDGYAHAGEEGGRTLVSWYKKLKVGGIMAGDDYSDKFPLTKWAVNSFVSQLDVELNVTAVTPDKESYSSHPSWFFVKERSHVGELIMPKELQEIAENERMRREYHKMRRKYHREYRKMRREYHKGYRRAMNEARRKEDKR